MGWNLYDDGYGTVEVYCSLQPIRSRKMRSLEHQMKQLLIEVDAFKAELRAAQMQVEAYQAGLGSLQTTFKLIDNIS